jgi:chlorobactene glucosyltransferase
MGSPWDGALLIACLGVTLLSAAVAGRLVLASKRIHWHPRLAEVRDQAGPLTVIIPARNEGQDLGAALQSLLAQTGVNLEVIVVNDHSTDRTGPIADAAARADRRVRVIHDPPLPPGWLGKCNAMHRAAAVASGDYLLFTDGDIRHHPRCLATALREREQHRLDFLSLIPLMECVSLWESVLTPGFAWGIMPRFATPGLRDGTAADAYAAGAFMLVRRAAFEAVAGFEGIQADVCDDIALARRLKKGGYRVGFRAAPELLQVRLFKSGSDAFWGPTKNVLSVLRGRLWLAPAVLLGTLVVFWTSLVGVAVGAWQGKPALLLAGGVAYAVQYASLWPSRWLFRFHPAGALLFPLAVLSLWCCLARALYHHAVRGTVLWRGRAVKVRGGPGGPAGRETN